MTRTPARWAAALVVAATLSGCTVGTTTDERVRSGHAGPGAATGQTDVPVDEASRPGQSGSPTPAMTRVDAPVCTTQRWDEPSKSPLRTEQLWTPDPGAPWGDFSTVTQGPDANDCTGERPPDAYCDQAVPWTGLSVEALVHATGAQTFVTGDVPGPATSPGAHRDPQSASRTMMYTLLTAAPGQAAAAGDIVRAGALKCAHAVARKVPGGTAWQGGFRSPVVPYGEEAPWVTFVAVVRTDGAAWASLQGPTWSQRDIDTAVRALQKGLERACTTC